jgi:glutathione S-transferase
MRWLGVLNSDVHPAFKPIFGPGRFHPDPAAAGILADTARARVRKLSRAARQPSARPGLARRRQIDRRSVPVRDVRWARRLSIDAGGLDNLQRFFERMQADAGVRAALTAQEGVPQ